jgi:hypothetical protein
VMFQYVIGDRDLERVEVIKDLGVLVDSRMTFGNHIESIVSKSARMFGFIKRISKEFNDPYTHKMLYVAFVWPGLEYASCVWSPHQEVHLARVERIQHNFIRFALRGLGLLSLCFFMRVDASSFKVFPDISTLIQVKVINYSFQMAHIIANCFLTHLFLIHKSNNQKKSDSETITSTTKKKIVK